MKHLNFLEKILFLINSIVAVLLLFTYVIPYIDPEKFSSIAILSLAYPTLLVVNIFFVIIWLIKLKPQLLVSLCIIGIGFNHIEALFSFGKKDVTTIDDIKILSYNVRQFNRLNWIKSSTVKQDICDFINKQDADIVCIQEFPNNVHLNFDLKIVSQKKRKANGLCILSKHKVINSGVINFENSINGIIYADLLIDQNIIRVYNIHLQSFGLNTHKNFYGKKNKSALFKKFKRVFKQQALQIKKLQEHIKACKYPTILAGDFNNTAFSWNYKQLTRTHKDAFVEAGSGFGSSYNYMLPFRIDFILAENNMKVTLFKNFKINLSDHYPILAHININN